MIGRWLFVFADLHLEVGGEIGAGITQVQLVANVPTVSFNRIERNVQQSPI